HFANPAEGGDPLLYQHMFWFFGHPEVYIIFIPALGMVSSILETHTRRAVFGYPAMVLSLVGTAFVGFGLWVHHMFATGLPLFGAFHHWFPKFTGRMISERLGKISFWILFVGFNMTFFPMHMLGLKGMTRRVYTYPLEMGWGGANLFATIGAFVILVGGIIFI